MKRLIALVLVWAPLGCVKAPDIVVVDRATALEQQAGGSFADLEQHLAQRAVSPGPEALTPTNSKRLASSRSPSSITPSKPKPTA
jgi:hypothetical protein